MLEKWCFMKKIILVNMLLLTAAVCFGQHISKITITGSGQVDAFSVGLDENVEVYVSRDGNISKWGYDKYIGYQENYTGVLEPYVGRVEYYNQLDDESLRGKINYILNNHHVLCLLRKRNAERQIEEHRQYRVRLLSFVRGCGLPGAGQDPWPE